MAETAWCVRCDGKVPITDARRVVFKNKREAIQGHCPHCGTVVSRIVKREATPR